MSARKPKAKASTRLIGRNPTYTGKETNSMSDKRTGAPSGSRLPTFEECSAAMAAALAAQERGENVSLLDVVMPNGKRIGNCTQADLRALRDMAQTQGEMAQTLDRLNRERG